MEHTATHKIKTALLKGDRLTTLAMLDRFQVMRGAAIVHRLKNRGLPIKTETITTGTKKRVARYYIDEIDRMVHRSFKVID